ncbi:aldehyde dehydrogenase [Niabella yanshanensis]|uniref:Aldehyde dehydrogenase n=1 Tax=Niabella yanshanensis TaxID=577386 RepID=A0ABZ0VZS0_9BACT|nr:aldehyde dehydrogenase [Niabella yanshanensis]WQD36513.1 aldehyde dehydrogenase [Niabella yanshanensis]
MSYIPKLDSLRHFFNSGATQELSFRKEQLKKLKETIIKYEQELNEALYKDLRKNKEEVWITETGLVLSEISYFLKNIDELAEPQRTATNLLNLPGKSYIMYEPLGVVLIIAPWNYPFQLSLIPLIGAIAAGNCAVLKPSEAAMATEAIIRKILAETFAPQYISFASGDGAVVVPDMVQRFRFDHIFYTGSTAVGRAVYKLAAEQLVPVTLELGGKSPCIVSAKANLKLAAKRIAMAKFSNAGQMCITPDYLLVHQSVKEAFVEILKQTITQFYGDHPVESYDYGRIINKKQFDRLMGYLQSNIVLAGGTHNEELLYIAPTLIDSPKMDDPIMQEEIFGPLLPVLTYTDDAFALDVIHHNPNPLAFYVFTDDSKEADWWLRKVPGGGACINAVAMHYLNKSLPFGGRGNSGIGRYHGKFSMETFSHPKAVLKAATWPDLPMAYPSFKGRLGLLKKIFK